jgi:aspartyl-tRNA(Asn)/glutamyl-tRNA(Gln) amidotransferase subunit A
MSIPAGLSQKMPVGLQMIGNYWSESKLLNIAHQFQQQTDRFDIQSKKMECYILLPLFSLFFG